MFKKLSAVACSCITVLLLLFSLIGGAISTAAVTLDEMTTVAISCIMSHEGSYGSVNRNDCGACSIGKLQWHAGRALGLLQTICNNAPELAQSTLGTSFYNEILSATNWNSRTFTVSEGNAVSTLLSSDAGIAAQDALAFSDVQGYIVSGQNKGLVDEGALVLYADIYNFGSGIASRIATRAAGYAGSYSAVTLDNMYQAALNDSYGSNAAFVQRTNMVYQDLVNMNLSGGGDVTTETTTTAPTTETPEETTTQATTTVVISSEFSDSYAGTYVVTASALNLRRDPSTSASIVVEMPRNAVVTVTAANGEWAAVTYEGNSGYCSMNYLKKVAEETTVTEETTTTTTETTTTTTETTTTTTEETTTTTETTTMETTTTVATEATTEAATTETTQTVATSGTEGTETTVAVTEEQKGLTATLYGDVDGDGEVTAIDAVLLQKHINGMVFLTHEQMANADCVADGVLDEADVAVILQHLIGRYASLPIC